jgi:23S rRNA pseudouridine2605 synthase
VIRLQKFLADAGLVSRRTGEQLILEGRVTVNGHTVRELGTKVDPVHDQVTLDGKPAKPKRKSYIALNKTRGLVCSHSDELKRPTIYDLLPPEFEHLHSVGRLDFNSEGLIFLTNDGDFSLHLTHPRYGIQKKYIATVDGKVDAAMLSLFTTGLYLKGEKLKAEKARVIGEGGGETVVEMVLAEGKNREVRRLFESQARTVTRLVRVQIGKIKLAELKPGKWRSLTESEIKSLLTS